MSNSDQTDSVVVVSISHLYALGFATFLQALLPDALGYEVLEHARTGADSSGARFKVRNAIGEVFKVDVEHILGDSR